MEMKNFCVSMLVFIVTAVIACSAPLDICEYIVKTNYGKFERIVVPAPTPRNQHQTPDGTIYFLNPMFPDKNITHTNWTVESTNHPISLEHNIYYEDTNKNSIIVMTSIEPLKFPDGWKYMETEFPVASVKVERTRNIMNLYSDINWVTNLSAYSCVTITNSLYVADGYELVKKHAWWQFWK